MKRNWLLILSAISLGWLIAYRAYVLPITHDEASTWLNYRHLNVWSCMYNPVCWGTANNHWLNTLLLQITASIFGDKPWALRLPNVLAGFGYLYGALLFSSRYTKNNLLQCAGFLLLCGHVYLLDFFSLARGYGMMAFAVLWGIYFLLRYIERYERRWLVYAVVILSVGILANFTTLLAWATIGLGWAIWLVTHQKNRLLIQHGWIWLVNALFLLILLYFPIKTLAKSGEFGWGSDNIIKMSSDLIINLLYGERFLGEHTAYYIVIGLGALMLLICCVSLLKKNIAVRPPVLFIALLVVLGFLVVMLHQKATGSLAPVGRKSIYLIPFWFSLLTLGLACIHQRMIGLVIGLIVVLILVYRIYHTIQFNYCREWYTDANYPELFSEVVPKGASSDSIRLSSSWIFNPPLVFYQQTVPLPISGLPYQRPLVIDSTMDYYYVEPSDTLGMSASGFYLHKKLGSFLLFRNTDSKK